MRERQLRSRWGTTDNMQETLADMKTATCNVRAARAAAQAARELFLGAQPHVHIPARLVRLKPSR